VQRKYDVKVSASGERCEREDTMLRHAADAVCRKVNSQATRGNIRA